MQVPKWILLLLVVAIIGQMVRWYTHDCPVTVEMRVMDGYIIQDDAVIRLPQDYNALAWGGRSEYFNNEWLRSKFVPFDEIYQDSVLAYDALCRKLESTETALKAQADSLARKRNRICEDS